MVSRSVLTAAVALGAAACGRISFDERTAPSGDGDAYNDAVLADGPVLYMRFDEPPGANTAYSSVGALAGPYEGTFVLGEPGALVGSTSARFDGTSTRIPMGDAFPFAGNLPYTLEVWIKAVDTENTRFVVDRRSSPGPANGYTFYLGANYFLASRVVDDVEMGYVDGGSLPLDTWVHTAITYDGRRHRLYMDGALVETSNITGEVPIGAGMGTFTIGDSHPGQFRKLDAWLDELAVYDVALTGPQIRAHLAQP